MKKYLVILVALALVLATGVAYAAYDKSSPLLYVNGKTLTTDVQPQIIDGRTMVPFRAVAEGLGAKVDWDAATKSVKVTTNPMYSDTGTAMSNPLYEASARFAASVPMKDMYIMSWEDAMVKMNDDPNFLVIDVRPPDHRTQGYVPGSIHYPLPNLPTHFMHLSKDMTYGVYCVMDTNSAFAVAMLNMNGYNAVIIPGGTEGYVKAGGTLAKDNG